MIFCFLYSVGMFFFYCISSSCFETNLSPYLCGNYNRKIHAQTKILPTYGVHIVGTSTKNRCNSFIAYLHVFITPSNVQGKHGISKSLT